MKTRNKRKSHPSSTPTLYKNHFSVLNLLPTAIIALISVLCFEEREVLAYMMTRSLNSIGKDAKKSSKKHSFDARHKSPPVFDCDCFQCYVSFWHKWHTSPNRVLIHNAIEAFEERLNSEEFDADALKMGSGGKSKKKEKTSRQNNTNVVENVNAVDVAVPEVAIVAAEEKSGGEVAPPVLVGGCKCLARKVLPDFMGLFNSRFWSLWNYA